VACIASGTTRHRPTRVSSALCFFRRSRIFGSRGHVLPGTAPTKPSLPEGKPTRKGTSPSSQVGRSIDRCARGPRKERAPGRFQGVTNATETGSRLNPCDAAIDDRLQSATDGKRQVAGLQRTIEDTTRDYRTSARTRCRRRRRCRGSSPTRR
jgi:hypothetical protein